MNKGTEKGIFVHNLSDNFYGVFNILIPKLPPQPYEPVRLGKGLSFEFVIF